MSSYKKQAASFWKKNNKTFSRNVYKKTGLVNPMKKGAVSTTRLFKDVAELKKMVNAEKKNVQTAVTTTFTFAQNNGAGTGAIILPQVATISQGVTEDQRTGDSLKAHSFVAHFEVSTNSFNTLQATSYKIYILRKPAQAVTGAAVEIPAFLLPNPFTGVVDYNSERNYENFRDYIVIGVINGKLEQNPNDSLNQVQKNQHKFARTLNFHMRFAKGTSNLISNEIVAILVADSGDTATTNYIKVQNYSTLYFYDN